MTYARMLLCTLLCYFLTITSTHASTDKSLSPYLGAKLILGAATLAVGDYSFINNPTAPPKEGKSAQRTTLIHSGGGITIGLKIPVIPLLDIRTELEYLRGRSAKTFVQSGETKLGFNTNTILFNTYFDFTSLHSIVKPYLALGVGLDINELKYTPASIDVASSTADKVTPIFQSGIGTYFLLGRVALDLNIRYLYNGDVRKYYINSNGNARRLFKASPHIIEGLVSILIFL